MLVELSVIISLLAFILVIFLKWEYALYQVTITFIVITSLIFFTISIFTRNERYSFILSYIPFAFMIITSFVYVIKVKEFNPIALVFSLIAFQIIYSLKNRYKKFKYLEELYIICLSVIGFWIILLKFYNLGTISLLLAINTALIIGFLSYYLLHEEEK